MAEINLIQKDTDIYSLNIHPLDWDLVMGDIPYYVAHIKGYVHSIGGRWGDNDLWAWPRNEEPSYENLVEFGSNEIVRWGMEFKPTMYIRSKYDESEICCSNGTMITRNDEPFYFVNGTMDYSLSKAIMIITKIQEEWPLDVNSIDFDKKLRNRVILYKGMPAVIESYLNVQGCIIIHYTGPDIYNDTVNQLWGCEDDDLTKKLDIIGYEDNDIEWFPEFNSDGGPIPLVKILQENCIVKSNQNK